MDRGKTGGSCGTSRDQVTTTPPSSHHIRTTQSTSVDRFCLFPHHHASEVRMQPGSGRSAMEASFRLIA